MLVFHLLVHSSFAQRGIIVDATYCLSQSREAGSSYAADLHGYAIERAKPILQKECFTHPTMSSIQLIGVLAPRAQPCMSFHLQSRSDCYYDVPHLVRYFGMIVTTTSYQSLGKARHLFDAIDLNQLVKEQFLFELSASDCGVPGGRRPLVIEVELLSLEYRYVDTR